MEQEISTKIDEVLEIARFIKDNGATQESMDDFKSEVDEFRREVREEFNSIKPEVKEIRDELEYIKRQLNALDRRTGEDSNALGGSYFGLHARMKKLEEKMRILELRRS